MATVERLLARTAALRERLANNPALAADNVSDVTGKVSAPQIGAPDLLLQISKIESLAQSHSADLGVPLLTRVVANLDRLDSQTLPTLTANANHVPVCLSAAYVTLDAAIRAIQDAIPSLDPLKEVAAGYRAALRRIQKLEDQVNNASERLRAYEGVLQRIEAVSENVEQFPEELDNLKKERTAIGRLVEQATMDAGAVRTLGHECGEIKGTLSDILEEAKRIIIRANDAYAASTSVGLAKAFDERAAALRTTTYCWVIGLIVALVLGGVFGGGQLSKTAELISNETSPGRIALSMFTAILSLGAPIWFAWISTKQIGQSFKLSEDYAFKAAASRAFEGYRSQAALVDKNLEARLLESAITRFDELPLRLLDPKSHSSPLAELLSSDVVQKAFRTVPDFAESMKRLAVEAVSARTSPKPHGLVSAVKSGDSEQKS